MNRTKDYTGFAIRFTGLGYMALWPLSSPGSGGDLFGASLICRADAVALLDFLCHAPHPLQLSPALHVLGVMSAMFVVAQFSLRAIGRARRKHAAATVDASALVARLPAKVLRPRKAAGPPRPVKPRAHFGLRGLPH